MKVSVSTLTGHQGAVLCVALDHVNNTSHVAAGAESGSCPVRVWDTRINGKSSQLAIHSKSKKISCNQPFQNGVTSVAFAPGHKLFCSWDQSLAAFDLRRPDQSIIQSFDDYVWLVEDFAKDEINQISISSIQPSGKWKIACCEDGGDVHVFHAGETTDSLEVEHTTLSGVHTNLCTGVGWQNGSSKVLISGSMDATICMWNVSKSRPISGGHITCKNDASGASTSGGSQLLNPPFVNSVDVSRTVCAVGLGDGTVGLYNIRTQQSLGRLRGHDSATACVTFVRGVHDDEEEDKESCSGGCENNSWNHLFSAGNDKKICLWNLNDGSSSSSNSASNDDEWEECLNVNKTSSSRSSKSKRNKKKSKSKRKKNKSKSVDKKEGKEEKGKEEKEIENLDYVPVRFEHPNKINWLDASCSKSGLMRLFVADETDSVTVYSGFQ